MIDLPPPTYQQTIESIAQCGIPRVGIKIAYQDDLQSDEVTIDDLGAVSDEKLRCLKNAVHPFYILTLTNGAQQVAFYEFSRREDRPKRKAEAREWARSKGLLNRVPSFDRERGLKAFAAATEETCGIKQGSALMLAGESALTFQPNFLWGTNFKKSAEELQCLSQIFEASDAYEHGISFNIVFIHNQVVAEPEEK